MQQAVNTPQLKQAKSTALTTAPAGSVALLKGLTMWKFIRFYHMAAGHKKDPRSQKGSQRAYKGPIKDMRISSLQNTCSDDTRNFSRTYTLHTHVI